MNTVSRFNRIVPTIIIVAAMLPLIAMAQASDIVTPVAKQVLDTVKVLVTIVFVLAVVVFGWGIVKFIFAGGDPTALGKAKSFLLWGVVGIAVMASVFGLISFLQTYFGVKAGGLTITPPIVQ